MTSYATRLRGMQVPEWRSQYIDYESLLALTVELSNLNVDLGAVQGDGDPEADRSGVRASINGHLNLNLEDVPAEAEEAEGEGEVDDESEAEDEGADTRGIAMPVSVVESESEKYVAVTIPEAGISMYAETGSTGDGEGKIIIDDDKSEITMCSEPSIATTTILDGIEMQRMVAINSENSAMMLAMDLEKTFIQMLEAEMEKVRGFWHKSLTEAQSSLGKLLRLSSHLHKLGRGGGTGIAGAAAASGSHSPSATELRHAEQIVREFHHFLDLLHSFCVVNYVSLAKILAKHDKVTSPERQLTPIFLEKARRREWSTNRRGQEMKERVEGMYAELFTAGSHRKALIKLRSGRGSGAIGGMPQLGDAFLTGFLVGLSAVVAGFAFYLSVLAVVYDRFLESLERVSALIVFRTSLLPLLMVWGHGLCHKVWSDHRINIAVIVGIDVASAINYYAIFKIAALITCLALSGILFYLLAELGYVGTGVLGLGVGVGPAYYPGIFLLALILVLIMPLPIFYHKTRRWLLLVLRRVVAAPFYAVQFRDFFMGDHMMSLGLMLLDLQFSVCYYVVHAVVPSHAFAAYQSTQSFFCTTATSMIIVRGIVASLPAFIRLLQCGRRYRDSGTPFPHLANAGKYLSTLVAIAFGVVYQHSRTPGLLAMFIITSIVNLAYAFWWDTMVDWSLFERQPFARHWWQLRLRSERMFQKTWVYGASFAFNFALRCSWALVVFPAIFDAMHEGTVLIIGMLEVVRRCHWSIYRVENEQISNIGQFRVVRQIPVPWNVSGGNE